MASKQNPVTAVCINYLRYFTMIESMPFSDMRPFGEGSDKEEGIRWRSYHLDQLQS